MTFTHALPTNNYGCARFIVSSSAANGTHTTIAAALTSASSGDTIFVRDGTYTENVTLKSGVAIVGWDGPTSNNTVIIDGTLTCSTASGTYSLSGLKLQNTSGAACVAVSGTVASVYISECYFNLNHSGTIGVNNSSTTAKVYVTFCEGDSTTTGCYPISNTSTGSIFLSHSPFFNTGASTTACVISGGQLVMSSCNFAYGMSFTNNSGLTITSCNLGISGVVGIEFNSSSTTNVVDRCIISSIGAAAITIATPGQIILLNSTIYCDQTNVITGTGTIQYGSVDFLANIPISATTQLPVTVQTGAFKVIMPAGDYTVLASDYFVGAATGAARAITLPASPITGQLYVIKDITGTGATHNITVGGNGKNIDGSSTFVMNTNYQADSFIFNGTQWNVI